MDELILTLQGNLKFVRGLMNWTQREFSDATTISPATISKMETGDIIMSPEQYILITKAISREVNNVLKLPEDSVNRTLIRWALTEKFTPERYLETLAI